jgi:hypothetical protein
LKDAIHSNGIFGRGGLIQAGDFILRPYRRGGLLRHLNSEIYPSARRFMVEYHTHATLWDAGFPTTEPIGYAYRRYTWGVLGVFITRKADAIPWPKVWENIDLYAQAKQVATLIKSLADWTLWSPDLNATNFLVEANGQFLALDWDKAKWTLEYNLPARYWKRLERSLRKLGACETLILTLHDQLTGEPG